MKAQLDTPGLSTTDLVAGPHLLLQRAVPTLLVSFARSGGSPESLEAVNRLVNGVVIHPRH